jgi:hypothetical protein
MAPLLPGSAELSKNRGTLVKNGWPIQQDGISGGFSSGVNLIKFGIKAIKR